MAKLRCDEFVGFFIRKGALIMKYAAKAQTPLGEVLLASDGSYLTGVWFAGQKYYGAGMDNDIIYDQHIPVFTQTVSWLQRYFSGENPKIDELFLAPAGSTFRQTVWKILCDIPYGHVRTYGDIAAEVAAYNGIKTMSAQAIGGAVGHNPISIIIPCHRVVGSNGSLTGYAGGIEKKQRLLAAEGVDMSKLSI